MKNKTKLLSLIISLSILINTFIPVMVLASDNINYENGQDIENETGKFSKKIIDTGKNNNEFIIDLSLEGKTKIVRNKEEKTKVLLLMDTSASMEGILEYGSDYSRLDLEKKAAKEFVRNNASKATKIGIMTFDDFPREIVKYTDNINELENAIDRIVATGETKTQKALIKASDSLLGYKMGNRYQFENDGYRKVIVLLTDGFPTAYYEMTNFEENNGEIRKTPYGETSYKYATGFNLRNEIQEINGNLEMAKNLSLATASQAIELRKHGIEIYTVPIGIFVNGWQEMPDPEKRAAYLKGIQNISTDDDYMFIVNKDEDFSLKLNEISQHAFNTIYNGKLTDPMAKYINRMGKGEVKSLEELKEKGGYLLNIETKNEDTEKVIRESLNIKEKENGDIEILGINLGENEKISIKYLIKVDTTLEGYDENIIYPTNNRTYLSLDNNREYEYNVPKVKNIKKEKSETKKVKVRTKWIGRKSEKADVTIKEYDPALDFEVVYGTFEINEENLWEVNLENLPKYKNGSDKEVKYSVKEYEKDKEGYVEIDGIKYESKITGNEEEGFVIINREIVEDNTEKSTFDNFNFGKNREAKEERNANKINIADENNKEETKKVKVTTEWIGKKPEKVEVTIKEYDPALDFKVVYGTFEINEENLWEVNLENLPKYKNGSDEEVKYSVKEYEKDKEGYVEIDGIKYESEITGNEEEGFVIINREIVEDNTEKSTSDNFNFGKNREAKEERNANKINIADENNGTIEKIEKKNNKDKNRVVNTTSKNNSTKNRKSNTANNSSNSNDFTYKSGKKIVGKDQSNSEVKTNFAYVHGYPDGNFYPEKGLTRAEATAIFARIKNERLKLSNMTIDKYSDVKANQWFTKYIAHLDKDKVVEGYLDGTFKPNNEITRAEFVTMLSKFAKLQGKAQDFADTKDHWASSYIEAVKAENLVNGYSNGEFKPDEAITREEVVTIMNRYLNRTLDVNFAYNNSEVVSYKDVNKKRLSHDDIIEASSSYKYTGSGINTRWIELIKDIKFID